MDDDGEKKRLLRQYPLKKHTEKTGTGSRVLKTALNAARQRGYFMERGEFFDGVIQIGVPLRAAAGNTVAALGACLQEFRVSEEDVRQVVGKIMETAGLISKELGLERSREGEARNGEG